VFKFPPAAIIMTAHDITEIFLKMVSNTIIPFQIIEPKKDHDIYDVENTCFLSFK
jgi:hypothetical protein